MSRDYASAVEAPQISLPPNVTNTPCAIALRNAPSNVHPAKAMASTPNKLSYMQYVLHVQDSSIICVDSHTVEAPLLA